MSLPWWFWIFPLGIAFVCIAYPAWIQRRKRK